MLARPPTGEVLTHKRSLCGGAAIGSVICHFGLSPHLEEMHKLFGARELTVLHAVASPYRERSPFDAQNLLENGMIKPFGRNSGYRAHPQLYLSRSTSTPDVTMAIGGRADQD